jgi:hypothetical protein
LEALVAHHDGNLDERMLKIVRIQASFSAACAFCIDMNSFQYEETHITKVELKALQGRKALEEVQTPLQFPRSFIKELKQHSTSERL